jgi:catenin alpha
VEGFREEKRQFDAEVSKWDDQGNDVIVLAKHMCMIMMEMTDFTRGMLYFISTLRISHSPPIISNFHSMCI